MKVLIVGGDGYLGWPTAMYLAQHGHQVSVVDSLVKRRWEEELGVAPLQAILELPGRVRAFSRRTGRHIPAYIGDVLDQAFVRDVLSTERPEAIIHYGEQPSAPFSMIDAEHAIRTQHNNVLGTLQLVFAMREIVPDAHLIKLGTMGEYGTPNIDIEEGYLDVEHRGRRDRLPFPKSPGSFYHLSKVHDSHNLMLATKLWDLRVTDLNQGVVYGTETDETRLSPELATSFHYDSYFGTVINRFVVQAASGTPLTIYGGGSQKRAFLNIRDTLQCVELALLNPAEPGAFRVFNQFTESFSIRELAGMVAAAARQAGLSARMQEVENPRMELEQHYYNPKNSGLVALGLKPRRLTLEVLAHMILWARARRDHIDHGVMLPKTAWRGERQFQTTRAGD